MYYLLKKYYAILKEIRGNGAFLNVKKILYIPATQFLYCIMSSLPFRCTHRASKFRYFLKSLYCIVCCFIFSAI